MDWSVQLYSARNHTPWDAVLRTLSELGYSQVEGFGGVYADPHGFRRLLDENGLSMPSAHFGIEALETDFATVADTARALGVELIACPYLDAAERPVDAAGWRAFGERLARAGERARAEGFGFAWHNHDFEFQALPDGTLPQTHILEAAPDIGWEIDAAWVIRGGADVETWIERHGERIRAVHVKDIARPGEGLDEDGWADLGQGVVDWAALMRAFREKTPAKYYILEHDGPADFERFARRSMDALKRF